MNRAYENGEIKPAGSCPYCGKRGPALNILAEPYKSGIDYFCQDCGMHWAEEGNEWGSADRYGYIEEA